MKNNYAITQKPLSILGNGQALDLFLGLTFLLVAAALHATKAQTPVEAFTVVEDMSFSTHEMNGADFASPLTTFNGAIYYTYIDPDLKGKVVKKDSNGTITENTVIEAVSFNDTHAELSLAVDMDGYIHLTGNMHGHPMRYWRSESPEDINNFVFYGNDEAQGGISGEAVSYPRFVKSRKGTLFLTFRTELVNSNIDGRKPGWLGGAIARYDTHTKRWTRLGSLNYSFTNINGEQLKGNDLDGWNEKVVVWDESGIGTDFDRAYQGYKLRMVVDKSNRLHLAWNIGRDKNNISSNLALEGTHIMYAYSDDEGNTWHKADGSLVTMPMTSQNADIVFQSPTARFGNFIDITVDNQQNPIILQGNTEDGFVVFIFKWNGAEWERVNYTQGDGWIKDLGFPVGWPGWACTDLYGVITSFDKPNLGTISRSWDGGQTWQEYTINKNFSISRLSVDREYLRQTGDLRFQNQTTPNNVEVVTVDFTSNDTLLPPKVQLIGEVNYQAFTSYGSGEDEATGVIELQNAGTVVYLEGNAWKKTLFDYTVTPATALAFDYKSTVTGEIHAIGLDNNNSYDKKNCTNPHGRIGDSVLPFNGTKYGFTVNQNLLEDHNGEVFRRLRVRNPSSESQSFSVEVYGAGVIYQGTVPSNSELFFSIPYTGNPTYRVFIGGKQITKASSTGSQSTACDIDDFVDVRVFQVNGSEAWPSAYTDFNDYDGSGAWKSYDIPIGEYYTGKVKYLAFVNDHDSGDQNGNAFFRNVRVYEKKSQTITFEPVTDAPFGSFELVASASSTLPVSFSIVSGIGTIVNGNILLTENTGSITIEARQDGDKNYMSAPPVRQTFTVLKADQSINFTPSIDRLATSDPFQISATASSGLPLTYSVVSGPATINGSTVTLTGQSGTVVVKAFQGGNENYYEAFAEQEIKVLPESTKRVLYKAFAFGANTQTALVGNEPARSYTKMVQKANLSAYNLPYTPSQGYGYTDLNGLDGTPNNRNAINCEVYDQYIGAKSGSIIFRVDVPNGKYRFVLAGGDAAFGNQNTTIKVRDGLMGEEFTLVENMATVNPKEFYQVGFLDKHPPNCSEANFILDINSPTLTVTNGYIEVEQSSNTSGGALNLLEVWEFDEPTNANSRMAASSSPEKQANLEPDALAPNVHIYPNPANQYMIFEVDFQNTASLSIYSSTGKKVFENANMGRVETINVSGFSTGIYTARGVADGEPFVYKILITK